MAYQTEYDFRLPIGLKDAAGGLHQDGVMRLATARDEIRLMQDHRVRKNKAYTIVLLLSRVVMNLGDIKDITPDTIEDLYAEDLRYLHALYQQVNRAGTADVEVACPHCDGGFHLDLGELAAGES